MSDIAKTIRVVSSDPASQGDFVEINEADFDESVHKIYVDPGEAAAKAQADDREAKRAAREAAKKSAVEQTGTARPDDLPPAQN